MHAHRLGIAATISSRSTASRSRIGVILSRRKFDAWRAGGRPLRRTAVRVCSRNSRTERRRSPSAARRRPVCQGPGGEMKKIPQPASSARAASPREPRRPRASPIGAQPADRRRDLPRSRTTSTRRRRGPRTQDGAGTSMRATLDRNGGIPSLRGPSTSRGTCRRRARPPRAPPRRVGARAEMRRSVLGSTPKRRRSRRAENAERGQGGVSWSRRWRGCHANAARAQRDL